MFMILVKVMLLIFILAGSVGIIYGVWQIMRTRSFVSSANGKVKGTFVGYHKEISKTTSYFSYSPSNPDMPSKTETYAVATYPEFVYRTDRGAEQIVRETKVHVFSIRKPGDEVEVILSSKGTPRLADFYSLYFRDLFILGLGLLAVLLATVFWTVALPLFTASHPVEVYGEESSAVTDSAYTADSVGTVEEVMNGILEEAWNFKVGPIRMYHILYGVVGMFVVVIILSFFFGSKRE